MTDQTTPEPLADDQLAEIRMHDRAYATDPSDAPILVEAATDRRLLLATVDRLRARNADLFRRLGEHMDDLGDARTENTRLHTWDGLMSLLDEHWPETILPTLPDEAARDAGSRIVSLIRWIEMLHTEQKQLRARHGSAPLTLAQAAGHLHDWARDLADGTRTDWPAGHPGIIRGIRAAADWLDARDKYETETREQLRALVNRHGMADRTCLISDNTTE